jgi:hypothetical protein
MVLEIGNMNIGGIEKRHKNILQKLFLETISHIINLNFPKSKHIYKNE